MLSRVRGSCVVTLMYRHGVFLTGVKPSCYNFGECTCVRVVHKIRTLFSTVIKLNARNASKSSIVKTAHLSDAKRSVQDRDMKLTISSQESGFASPPHPCEEQFLCPCLWALSCKKHLDNLK